jgi:hypothetical protein
MVTDTTLLDVVVGTSLMTFDEDAVFGDCMASVYVAFVDIHLVTFLT